MEKSQEATSHHHVLLSDIADHEISDFQTKIAGARYNNIIHSSGELQLYKGSLLLVTMQVSIGGDDL